MPGDGGISPGERAWEVPVDCYSCGESTKVYLGNFNLVSLC